MSNIVDVLTRLAEQRGYEVRAHRFFHNEWGLVLLKDGWVKHVCTKSNLVHEQHWLEDPVIK